MDYASSGFVGETLFDDEIQLNFDEIRFNYTEDDPETEIDETTQVEERLTPRIRVPLNRDFFKKSCLI